MDDLFRVGTVLEPWWFLPLVTQSYVPHAQGTVMIRQGASVRTGSTIL